MTDISRRYRLQTEIEEFIPTFQSFAKTFCKSPVDADDLVQETLARTLASLDQFTEGMSLKSWMFTIMHDGFRRKFEISKHKSQEETKRASEQEISQTSED